MAINSYTNNPIYKINCRLMSKYLKELQLEKKKIQELPTSILKSYAMWDINNDIKREKHKIKFNEIR
tara:strand:- start:1915 stop:2115 length:201 start_codon:yes stop_codon:yes gene_type:complete